MESNAWNRLEQRDWAAPGFCVFVVAVSFLGSVASIQYVTLDDRWYAAWAWGGTWVHSAVDTAAQQGRLLKPSSFTMFLPYLADELAWPATFRLGSIALAALLAGLLLRKFVRSNATALLFVLLFFAFAQNSQDHNLFVAYPFAWEFSWITWMAGLYALRVAIERGSLAIALGGSLIWVFGLQEGFVPQTVIFVLVAFTSFDSAGRRWRYLAPYLMCMLAWAIAWVLWRSGHPSSYEGSRLAVDGSIVDVIRTLIYFSLGGMPVATIFNDRSVTSLQSILDCFDTRAFIKMVAVFLGFLWLSRAESTSSNVFKAKPMLTVLGVLLTLAFLPNLLLAFTPKYQEWTRFGVHAYLYSHFSYFAWIGLGTVVLLAMFQRWKSKMLAIGLALLASLASLVTDASNRVINQEQEMFGARWRSMLAMAASEEFEHIPAGSRIYFSDRSVTGNEIGDAYYWSYVLKARTGKDVLLSPDIDSFREGSGPAYYLYLYDEPRSANRYVILAPLEQVGQTSGLQSRHLFVYPASENKRVQVGGILRCPKPHCLASIATNSRLAAGLFVGAFTAAGTYRSDTHGVPLVEVESSEPIDIASVWVDFARNLRMPPMPVEILAETNFLGWQESGGIEFNWGGTDASLVLHNTTEKDVSVVVEFWVVAGDARSLRVEDAGGKQLTRMQLDPTSPGFARIGIQALKGRTEIRLHSDEPPLYNEGPKGMAFQLRAVGLRADSQISAYDFE